MKVRVFASLLVMVLLSMASPVTSVFAQSIKKKQGNADDLIAQMPLTERQRQQQREAKRLGAERTKRRQEAADRATRSEEARERKAAEAAAAQVRADEERRAADRRAAAEEAERKRKEQQILDQTIFIKTYD